MTYRVGEAKFVERADLAEDLETLAPYQYRLAQTSCVDCNQYHAIFGYARLAGANSTAPDREAAGDALRKVSRPGARIVIAGAADAGLLAFAAVATYREAARITVADRCATPLMVCRRYAEAKALHVATTQSDLTHAPVQGSYDVAFAHNILLFIPRDRQAAFLRNIGSSLADNGSLVLVHRINVPERTEDGLARFGNFATEIENRLAAKGIPIPDDPVLFRQRLNQAAGAERARMSIPLSLAQLEESLEAAGFRVAERIVHHNRRATRAREGREDQTIPTYVFTASRRA